MPVVHTVFTVAHITNICAPMSFISCTERYQFSISVVISWLNNEALSVNMSRYANNIVSLIQHTFAALVYSAQ